MPKLENYKGRFEVCLHVCELAMMSKQIHDDRKFKLLSVRWVSEHPTQIAQTKDSHTLIHKKHTYHQGHITCNADVCFHQIVIQDIETNTDRFVWGDA